MRAKKKTQRLWNLQGTNTFTFTADAQEEQVFFSLTDEDFAGGAIRMHRLIWSANLYVENYVAGSVNLHLWHGLVISDGEDLEGQRNNLLNQSDDNAAWLWREPIQLFKCPMIANVDDFHASYSGDWPIRGGKGSTLQAGYDWRYVVNCAMNGAATQLKWNMLGLSLFSVS